MLSKWPKVICDPLHSLIPFEDTDCDRLLLNLINTKEFQRLRRIKQLGMSEVVFPGANHSRFAHSIGVMHMARRFLDRIDSVSASALKPTREQRLIVLVAALLHDLGHGPFSHAFEKVTEQSHERWSETIIRDEASDVHKCLIAHSADLPNHLLVFFDSDVEDSVIESQGIPPYLTQIVSSQLDADRFDYLLRDSYASGTTTGEFEYGYIIQNLFLDDKHRRLFVGRKALLAAEAYVLARYRMYQTVYYHKTTRAAEVMLKLVFRRFRELIQSQGIEKVKADFVKDAPQRVYAAFAGEITLDDYLALDDSTITEFFKCAAMSADPILQSLSEGILCRRLYKALDVSSMDFHVKRDFKAAAEDKMRNAGYTPEFQLVEDTATDTPYKLYDPSMDKPSTVVYVESEGDIVEISTKSDPIKSVVQKYTLVRYYFPEEARDLVSHAATEAR